MFWPVSVAKAPPPLSFLPRSLHEPPKVATSSFYTKKSSMPRLAVRGDTYAHAKAEEPRPLFPTEEARMTARVWAALTRIHRRQRGIVGGAQSGAGRRRCG
jgi:hypothetical protein